jgi:hypothetical protein
VIGQDEVEVVETAMSACSPYPGEFARAHEGVGDVTEGGTVIGDDIEETGIQGDTDRLEILDTDPEDNRGVGGASSDFDDHS